MPCPYYNKEKDNIGDGIYCNRMGGRPGVKYWNCYCDHRYSDCPIYGGDDPYELDPRTRERKKREEDKKKANEVVQLISYIAYSVSVNDAREIENARYVYDRLTSDQKGYVSNYYRLTEAERALTRARTAKENEEAERRAEERRKQEQSNQTQNNYTQSTKNVADTSYTRDSNYSNGTWGVDKHGEWYIDSQSGLKLYKAPRSYRIKHSIWSKFDPVISPQPLLMIISRIALAVASVLGWYYGLPYNTPRAAEWFYIIFGCGQLLSLIFSYIFTDKHKLRLVTWGICLLSLAIMILLLYLNYNLAMVIFIVLISFFIPICWFGWKAIVKIAEFFVNYIF